jgi:hypothetical protein
MASHIRNELHARGVKVEAAGDMVAVSIGAYRAEYAPAYIVAHFSKVMVEARKGAALHDLMEAIRQCLFFPKHTTVTEETDATHVHAKVSAASGACAEATVDLADFSASLQIAKVALMSALGVAQPLDGLTCYRFAACAKKE